MSNITNLNRDYLIKINVKEATIDVPKMTFWNTDKKTSNMFVQLVINMSTNELISNYVTVQNATDYKITLNVIKPKTNQYKTIEATLLNEEKALFEIDLPDEYKDQVGNYNFEFEVSSKVDGNDESITTSNATYEVKGSILTNLNEETSSSPDLPILKQLIEQVKSLQGGDLTGYQKKSDTSLETTSKEIVGAINEVNSQYKDIVKKIESGNVNLSSYATKNDLQNVVLEKVVSDNTDVVNILNLWKNKKGGCLGDSISAGYYTDKTFYNVAKDILHMSEFVNYGISGTCIGGTDSNAMSIRYSTMSDDLDVILVAGGVNDMGLNIALGTPNDTTTSTFYGALKVLCEGLLTKYPKGTIIFITPAQVGKPINFYSEPNAQGYTVKDYRDAVIEVCSNYPVYVYDNYTMSGIYPKNNTNRNIYTKDGLHWNTAGHYRVGVNLAKYMLFNCVPCLANDVENIPCTNITLNNITLAFTNKSPQTLTATITPTNATDTVAWSVSPTGIVAVDNGVITPISNGNCIVTVTCGTKTATCNVTVSEINTQYTITNNLTNCTNSNSATTIEENNNYLATITANSGYVLETVTVTMGGTDITSTVYNNGAINISTVTGNIIVTANAIEQVEIVDYTGKTLTVTGIRNTGFHFVTLIAVDSDVVNGNTVKTILKISNISGGIKAQGFSSSGFGDNSGEVSNNSYAGQCAGNASPTITTEGNITTYSIERTLTSTPTTKYLKFPLGISCTPPGSFKIEEVKTYVNNVEKDILKIGGFWTEETFTIK